MASSIRTITHRQMRAVEFWVKSGFKSKAKALLAAGYGKSVIGHPEKVFSSPAVLEELLRRGYDKYGLSSSEVSVSEPATPSDEGTPLNVDFSQLSKEHLRTLKERLAEVPLVTLYPR